MERKASKILSRLVLVILDKGYFSVFRTEIYNPRIKKPVRVPKAPRMRLFEISGEEISIGFVGSGVGVSGKRVWLWRLIGILVG